ncbi:G-type lectin S-receptor-like serine/threonine-protein kinase At2g19130 [Magnolia sinica]|uniref:G-type lectin S-receptor-like serine/threonine-protein kinase At2g19130 n=1 Tax=Magnolia sinica TaxID=86752 RepID=UPI00265847E1|nr:G-type lectin S-receptor-like serine/threonine-protein kinase At2g19130 [Magnolia sinica]
MAADRLSPGKSLTGNQIITSSGDRFVLGFFTPGNSSNYYIGIWYKKVSTQTVIWVANRETPLPNTSSQLRLTEDGNLVLFNQSNTPIWSSNSTSANPNSTVLVLLDTGNLVLRDGSNSTAEIWQSFDHPTDTWMPTGKVGLNRITGVNQRLISWWSKDDPAPGPFSLEINPNSTNEFLILWNSSKQYWTSGAWNGQIFSSVPEMRGLYIYNFSFQDDQNGKYFMYSVYDNTSLLRFVMDTSGQIKQMTWLENSKNWNLFWSQPRAQCDVYSLYGAFGSCEVKDQTCTCVQGFEPTSAKDWNLNDWSRGCGRKTKLQCGSNSSVNGEKDRFQAMPDMQLPENQLSLPVGSPQECESACLSNCSCNAYAYDSGCLIWNGNLMNLRQLSAGGSNGGTLYLRLAASEFPSSSSKKGVFTGAIVGAVAGIAVILL